MAISDFVTVAEAARVLGVNRRTVWRLISQGRLHAVTNPIDRRGKLVRWEDVEGLAHAGGRGEAADSSRYPWPQTIGAADLGISSDEAEEWLEANWRPL